MTANGDVHMPLPVAVFKHGSGWRWTSRVCVRACACVCAREWHYSYTQAASPDTRWIFCYVD